MVSLHIAQVSNLGKLVYRKLCHLATSITEFEMESQTSCGKTLPFGDNLLQNLALLWGSWRVWKRSAKSQTVTESHPATRIPRGKPRGRKNRVGSAHLVSRPGRFRSADASAPRGVAGPTWSTRAGTGVWLGGAGRPGSSAPAGRGCWARPERSFPSQFPVSDGPSRSCG